MAFLDKLYGIFGADEQPSPGANGLMVDPQAQVKRDTLMATAAQLLAGSGYSPVRQSTSEILGRALLAGQQARAAAQSRITQQQQAQTEQQLRQAQIDQIKNPTTADITEFKYAQQNGYTGDFNTFLQQKLSARAEPPASIQEWNLVNAGRKANGQPPLTLDQWLQQRADMSLKPFMATVGNVPTIVQPTDRAGGITQTPLNTPQGEIDAARAKASAEGEGKATGTATGEAAGGKIKRGANADTVIGMLELAEPLIDASTGSVTGAAADRLAGVFGVAPKGAQAAAQLKVIQAGLMTNMPRMEGPQSDRDVQLYRDASGQIGDPSVPNAIKKVAVKTIRQLQEKYKDAGRPARRIRVDAQGNVIGN